MKRFFSLSLALLVCLISCSSCTSLYLEEFDTPVHEGVKNYSLTDLERNIVEMPGDQQDILMGVPGLIASPPGSCLFIETPPFVKKVWICDTVSSNGERKIGHYKIFSEEKIDGAQ